MVYNSNIPVTLVTEIFFLFRLTKVIKLHQILRITKVNYINEDIYYDSGRPDGLN